MDWLWPVSIAAAVVATFGFLVGRKSTASQINELKRSHAHQDYQFGELKKQAEATITKQRSDLTDQHTRIQKDEAALAESKAELRAAKAELEEHRREYHELQEFCSSTLETLRGDGALLPSAVRWAIRLQEMLDKTIVERLYAPPHPAPTAASQVREAREIARKWQQEAELLRNRIDLYESQAPWLIEYAEFTIDEVIAGLQEEAEIRRTYAAGDDPVKLFLVPGEWDRLSNAERNQLALDRYWEASRRRTAWTAGIQYERYIGYRYEMQGYEVEYHGAVRGKQDLGIDLVCIKSGIVQIVQCKRLSVHKEIPVRENVVAQVYGAAMFYALNANLEPPSVKPMIVTTYELSNQARQFAEMLGVEVREYCTFERYACIKCNISERTGERIYHLPFDQQYDTTKIGNVAGEFYATTVAEAERAQFRRAFRWRDQ